MKKTIRLLSILILLLVPLHQAYADDLHITGISDNDSFYINETISFSAESYTAASPDGGIYTYIPHAFRAGKVYSQWDTEPPYTGSFTVSEEGSYTLCVEYYEYRSEGDELVYTGSTVEETLGFTVKAKTIKGFMYYVIAGIMIGVLVYRQYRGMIEKRKEASGQ